MLQPVSATSISIWKPLLPSKSKFKYFHTRPNSRNLPLKQLKKFVPRESSVSMRSWKKMALQKVRQPRVYYSRLLFHDVSECPHYARAKLSQTFCISSGYRGNLRSPLSHFSLSLSLARSFLRAWNCLGGQWRGYIRANESALLNDIGENQGETRHRWPRER